ncbi:hypothetical protein D3C87_1874060 [compost metagenome]
MVKPLGQFDIAARHARMRQAHRQRAELDTLLDGEDTTDGSGVGGVADQVIVGRRWRNHQPAALEHFDGARQEVFVRLDDGSDHGSLQWQA